jgi:hypothetical protein
MSEDDRGTGSGMLLLSFLVGAAVGSTLLLLFKHGESEKDDSPKDDSPMFI